PDTPCGPLLLRGRFSPQSAPTAGTLPQPIPRKASSLIKKLLMVASQRDPATDHPNLTDRRRRNLTNGFPVKIVKVRGDTYFFKDAPDFTAILDSVRRALPTNRTIPTHTSGIRLNIICFNMVQIP